MKISSPTEPKAVSPIKILLMGPPGTFKTTLSLQFPVPHVFDADHNLDGPELVLRKGITDLVSKRTILPPIKPDLSYTFDDTRSSAEGRILDISECYDRLISLLSMVAKEPEYKNVKTFILDSLSHVNEFVIRKVLSKASKDTMEIKHWNDFASFAYTILVAKLDQLSRAVICTCHEEKVTEADSSNMMKKKTVEINPLFSGRVGDSIGAFFTDVWKLEKRKGLADRTELWLQTVRTDKCEHLKNSVGMPGELEITKGFSVIEPYLKGRI